MVLPCGNFKLIYDKEADQLWPCTDDKKGKSTAVGPAELFSFGSGGFASGPEATDVMSDSSGRWINFALQSDKDLCIVEADRRLSEHIKKADIFGTVSCFSLSITVCLSSV